MPNDTPFPVFVNERNVKILTTCTGKTETSTLPSEQLLHGADKKIKCNLKTKLFQNVKFTLEKEMVMILATILMNQVKATL